MTGRQIGASAQVTRTLGRGHEGGNVGVDGTGQGQRAAAGDHRVGAEPAQPPQDRPQAGVRSPVRYRGPQGTGDDAALGLPPDAQVRDEPAGAVQHPYRPPALVEVKAVEQAELEAAAAPVVPCRAGSSGAS